MWNSGSNRKSSSQIHLQKMLPMIGRNQVAFLGGGTLENLLTEVVDRTLVRPESLNLSSCAIGEASNFPKGDALFFNFIQRFTAI